MKHIRLVVLAVLALAVAGALLGAATASSKKKYVIGVSYQNLAFPYVAALQKAAQNEGKKLGVKLLEADAKNDTSAELANVEDLLNKGIDCLAFEAASLNASKASIEAANKKGVPVVQFNGKANGGKYVTFVGSRQIDSGKLLGSWLVGQYKKLGKPTLKGIYLRGVAGQITDIARSSGVKATLAKAGLTGKIKFIQQYADYDRGKGQSVTESILAANPKVDFIIANNDDMILGALSALQGRSLAGKVPIAGVDGLPETLVDILKGLVAATVFQNPEGQGGGGIKACVDHLNGKTLPKEILIPFKLVTKANAAAIKKIADRVYVK